MSRQRIFLGKMGLRGQPMVLALGLAVALTSMLSSGVAHADSAKDLKSFQTAWAAARANSKGTCKAIPFGSARGSCAGLSGNVAKYCKSDKYSCNEVHPKIKKKKKAFAKAKQSLSNVKSKEKTDKTKEAIKTIEKNIADIKNDFKALNSDAKKRLEQATGCYRSRKAVMTTFDRARSKVGSQSTSGLSDSDRADMDGLKRNLATYLKKHYDNHKEALRNVDQAKNICSRAVSVSL